eukprot:TRINITY_DN1114_c0_g1_i1.p1 TRINITY_DN1114_c0_g1~~TRINITY_DN1114_c0_g1_i1.p1  ORF type:complete len:1427 (+),score=326.26 TRINITY_DN1114_c0_g1_i1:428-4282(+)
MEVIEYLMLKGADPKRKDRWDSSPIVDAIKNGNDKVIELLRQHGGDVSMHADLVADFIQACSVGDLEHLEDYRTAGVKVDASDYDGRTALHVASSSGKVEVVRWLLEKGAYVDPVDVFGNTPYQDALRGDSRAKREIQRLFLAAGADADADKHRRKDSRDFKESLNSALPLLCERGGFDYGEIWAPDEAGGELLPSKYWYATKKATPTFSQFYRAVSSHSLPVNSGFPGRAYASHGTVSLSEIPTSDLGIHKDPVLNSRVKSGLAVPLIYDGKVHVVLVFFSLSEKDLCSNTINTFSAYCSGLVGSGFFSSTANFEDINGISSERIRKVYEKIVKEGVFNEKHIYQEVDWFFRMGLPQVYFDMFTSDIISNHIHCVMAAKKVALTMDKPEDIYVHIEKENRHYFFVPATWKDSVEVETRIEKMMNESPAGNSFSVSYLMSSGKFIPYGSHQLSMYYLDITPYVGQTKEMDESNIFKVASDTFLRNKTFEIRNRYQEILAEAVTKMEPTMKIHPQSEDGTIPVTLAIHHDQFSSFLLKFTEVLKFHQIQCSRKFIETFSNGLVVYSFYLVGADADLVSTFLGEIQLLSLIPGTAMRQLFLGGGLGVNEFAYAASIRKCIYYFLNQRSEEFEVLSTALKNDHVNQGRLNLLATRLRREAVSAQRITQAMFEESVLVKELYQDFLRCCAEKPSYNEALAAKINKSAQSEINAQILLAFVRFNAHLLKTNFWKPSKAALSFSFDASFLVDVSFPENPFVIFFVLGQEFQAFHIRFRDISRGGIRVIKSANRHAYNLNLEGQFMENYNLALTQNLKNKDILEFGSKGTVLLNANSQHSGADAFKKYVAALLDLLIILPEDKIVDHFGRDELLFLGPDENTADLMEWAARYARERGYAYWKAFTTGKPSSLGGVPHDTYGMTTNSVHRYVLGCLEKLGLKEEEMTKFQTGGPDGDLGSNEVLISKDKTISIVDGAGVLYDPLGLDRTELNRLAEIRSTSDGFDKSKLSEGGFFVGIDENDVTLPNGELIERGLQFRNNFHFHELSKADIFVPCGGRPGSVNLHTVNNWIDPVTGRPKYKIIVEGANLFITQDARIVLEDAGVILFKDASANKGGVTSSSLEVLAAVTMTDEEHAEHMSVTDPANLPEFYATYVSQIQEMVKMNADQEFECVWKENLRTKVPRCVLTDKVSQRINELNDQCRDSHLYDNIPLRQLVLSNAIPARLQQLVPIEEIVRRLPDNYSRALFGCWISSNFIYKYGTDAGDFAFYDFVTALSADKKFANSLGTKAEE